MQEVGALLEEGEQLLEPVHVGAEVRQADDPDLGNTLSHGGGYPGYGSHVLILPDYGVGIFALANRTYAGPRSPVWDAAMTLLEEQVALGPRPAGSDESRTLARRLRRERRDARRAKQREQNVLRAAKQAKAS